MQEPITYFIDHSTGTVDLTLTDERFVAKTQGKGLIDKPRTVDIPIAYLKQFCLVPTIAPQNLVSYRSVGDLSYDAEFIFSYKEGEHLKKKRVGLQTRPFSSSANYLDAFCVAFSVERVSFWRFSTP